MGRRSAEALLQEGADALAAADWDAASAAFERAQELDPGPEALVSGCHEGELMGTAPTGRDVSFTMLTISRCEGGRIAEEWEIADTVSLLQQVGALPAPTTA